MIEPEPSKPRGSPETRAVLAYASAAVVLLLTRYSPEVVGLGAGPGGSARELFGWLAWATAVTGLVPAAVMVVGLRQSLRGSGLGWGRSRRDAFWIALGLVGAVASAAVVAHAPEVRAYYPRLQIVKVEPLWWIPSTLAFAAYGLCWEMLFRGYLLVGVVDRLGGWAVLLQTVPFVLAHVDKPAPEMWLSIPGGLFFGAAAYRTRSVVPGFLLHFTLSTSVNLFCAYG